jgi:hypothetical protein
VELARARTCVETQYANPTRVASRFWVSDGGGDLGWAQVEALLDLEFAPPGWDRFDSQESQPPTLHERHTRSDWIEYGAKIPPVNETAEFCKESRAQKLSARKLRNLWKLLGVNFLHKRATAPERTRDDLVMSLLRTGLIRRTAECLRSSFGTGLRRFEGDHHHAWAVGEESSRAGLDRNRCLAHCDSSFANRPATLPVVSAVLFGRFVAPGVFALLAATMLVADLLAPADVLSGAFALTGR